MKHVALVMSLNKRFDRKVIEGVTRFVRESGNWSVFLEDDPAAKVPDFDRGHFEGVIADLDDPRIPRHVAGLDLPIVGIGAIRDDCRLDLAISTVNTNNQRIAVLAAEHLLDRGLQHFAYCGTRSHTLDPWNRQRREAFLDHLRKSGRECSAHTGRFSASHSWEQVQKQLADWLAKLPKPMGLLAANDARARHVLEACRRSRLRVPDDVAVMGVDNDELICNLACPPLTSIAQGTEEIGYQAARLLDRMMRRPARKITHRVIDPIAVITRESTDMVATEDPVVSNGLYYIRQHACRGLSVAEVARETGVSRSTLASRFKQIAGRTVHNEIRRVQLSKACELLATTDLALDRVASRAGFGNAQYMNAVFRRKLKQTPGRYRRGAR
jgi:LacI family transcriptional regulator